MTTTIPRTLHALSLVTLMACAADAGDGSRLPDAAVAEDASQGAVADPDVMLDDALDGETTGMVIGGRFVDGGGYAVESKEDRIVWPLPDMSRNGMLEVEIRNLDPTDVTATKNIFLSLWGRDIFTNHEDTDCENCDGFEIRMGTAVYKGIPTKQFRVELHANGIGRALYWEPVADGKYDPDHTYRFKFVWIRGNTWLFLDDQELYTASFTPMDPIDHFEWLALGSAPNPISDVVRGPVFSNVRITALDPNARHP